MPPTLNDYLLISLGVLSLIALMIAPVLIGMYFDDWLISAAASTFIMVIGLVVAGGVYELAAYGSVGGGGNIADAVAAAPAFALLGALGQSIKRKRKKRRRL